MNDTYYVDGCYGSGHTDCTVFIHEGWYCVEGSSNVNFAQNHEDLDREFVDVEDVDDSDSFSWSSPINSLEELEAAVNY